MSVDCYPNVSVAYRILLTVPVTVALAERSFSKLKLLKNCLRSTMLQERLNGLAMCCIEKDILDNIDLDIVLNDFTSRNARRSFFMKHWNIIVNEVIGIWLLFEVIILAGILILFWYSFCLSVEYMILLKCLILIIECSKLQMCTSIFYK